jgi:hypothetical protein
VIGREAVKRQQKECGEKQWHVQKISSPLWFGDLWMVNIACLL